MEELNLEEHQAIQTLRMKAHGYRKKKVRKRPVEGKLKVVEVTEETVEPDYKSLMAYLRYLNPDRWGAKELYNSRTAGKSLQQLIQENKKGAQRGIREMEALEMQAEKANLLE